MSTKTEATIEDLYKVDGKAELVNGEIVLMSPTGGKPSMAARAIVLSLYEYERRTKSGYAVTDNAAFKVNPIVIRANARFPIFTAGTPCAS